MQPSGEEFAVLLYAVDGFEAETLADRMRLAVGGVAAGLSRATGGAPTRFVGSCSTSPIGWCERTPPRVARQLDRLGTRAHTAP